MEIQAFLTAYDPSDLPGTSIDPLGFERGYLFLADKILPGLTNVANRPRYFSMLCAGAYLAGNLIHESPRKQYSQRLERITRMERFWALANALVTMQGDYTNEDLPGLRGVTYAKAKADDIVKKGDKRVDADFKLLSRQVQYGGVGIYGAVADRMRFLDRQLLSLSPDLGEKLAAGFIEESALPKAVRKAVEEDGLVDVGVLTSWGNRAYINGRVGKTEAECFRDALHLDPLRSRMTELLAKYPEKENESELKRLLRICKAIEGDKGNLDLKKTIYTILYYEESYRWALLAFQRLLWLCRQDHSGAVSYETLGNDPVIEKVRKNLAKAVKGFLRALEKSTTKNSPNDSNPLGDVSLFLQDSASSCENGDNLIENIMARHSDIQRGKFDKGRRKMPWVEFVSKGRISLTTTRVGGLGFEVKSPNRITPHPYRLSSADALYNASRRI